MARLESQAAGGYWPTPEHLLPRIARLFQRKGYASIVDPCCGEGAAVLEMSKLIPQVSEMESWQPVTIFGCEMEASRAAAAHVIRNSTILHGDAFQVVWESANASLLYLNPPYDQDREFGRLEERFLRRFVDVLGSSGSLCFVVPATSLAASAKTLAENFEDLRCWRFPDEDYAAFKQVVLIGRKRPVGFSAQVERTVLEWSVNGEALPTLPEAIPDPLLLVSTGYGGDVYGWRLADMDIKGIVARYAPFHHRGRQITDLLPASLQDIMLRTYPVAVPPRPAHIASGIAAGVFNGSRIDPNTPNLNPLLVKGCFDREFRTVETKTNKTGEITGYVQVQQPKLRVTVLDLETFQYHTLPETGVAEPTKTSELSISSLLSYYGPSLMTAMERQCPISFDPRRDKGGPLPESPRKLFRAQANAVHALVKLLGGPGIPVAKRRGRSAILLGEIGSGKSSTALQTARASGSTRTLVLCPPHLLQSWTNELAATAPGIRAVVLEDPADIDSLVGTDNFCAILSRERAKLSHGLESVKGQCPRCGTPVPNGDLAKKRAHCEHQTIRPSNVIASTALDMAGYLSRVSPDSPYLHFLNGRMDELRKKRPAIPYIPYNGDCSAAIAALVENEVPVQSMLQILIGLNHPDLTFQVLSAYVDSTTYWDNRVGHVAALIYNDPRCIELLQRCANEKESWNRYSFTNALKNCEDLRDGRTLSINMFGNVYVADGTVMVDGVAAGSLKFFERAVGLMVSSGTWKRSKPCGEALYQAVPEPRRVALADYIQRRHSQLFDFLILDECHELTSENAAQSAAASRLQGMKLPTIRMTGTIMNGYADSLFTTMWATSPEFRAEFPRDARSKYIDRYGYRKQLVDAKEKADTSIEYGANSDRILKSGKVIGQAPGVLPLFLLRHLLAYSVTLHKSDLAIDLPECTQEIVKVTASDEQLRKFDIVRSALVQRMTADRFETDRSGRLMGQLAELPSYLDRMTRDTGNAEHGRWVVQYPETLQNEIVCSEDPIDTIDPMPKEVAMLDRLEAELAEGRNVMVFAWHIQLLPRLARLIEARVGEKAPILYAEKVAPSKRQDWIDREIIKKKRRILVCNPVAIQTGLNNLVHFSTQLWMENPACNPNTFRQAGGRIDRIGQKLPTRIVSYVYDGTIQVNMQDLLASKVAVATATDGLDPESALRAAGVGDDTYLAALSVGKHLWQLLNGDEV